MCIALHIHCLAGSLQQLQEPDSMDYPHFIAEKTEVRGFLKNLFWTRSQRKKDPVFSLPLTNFMALEKSLSSSEVKSSICKQVTDPCSGTDKAG